jgi:hypothetical protein
VVLGDHVGNADAPARLEYPEHLGEYGGLVGRQAIKC